MVGTTDRPRNEAAVARVAVPRRALAVYLAVSFGVAWALFGLVALSGGLSQPQAGLLLALAMFAPLLGALAARRASAPTFSLGVRRRGPWRWLIVGWLGTAALLTLGALLCGALGVQAFDPNFGRLRDQLAASGQSFQPPPLGLALAGGALFSLLAAWFNMLFAFGEEAGWRGWLLGALLPLGARRAAALVGVIWGVWHAPLIVQGWNYPGEPLWGVLAMIGFCLVWGILFAWLRLRSGSVWPAALAHGTLNAWAPGQLLLFAAGNPLLGLPVGLVVTLPALVVALLLLRSPVWQQRGGLPHDQAL